VHGLIRPTPPRPTGGPRTVDEVLDDWLAAAPDDEALIGRFARYTVAALDDAATRGANALAGLGIGPGDRVAASLPNQADVVVAFLAVQRLGAVWVGINRPLAGPEKAYMLADAQVGAFLGDPEMVEQVTRHRADLPDLRALVTVDAPAATDEWRDLLAAASAGRRPVAQDPLAPAAIAYTSGTTGFPKGAVHSQHNMLLVGTVNARRGLYRSSLPGARLGVALPLTILNLMVLIPLFAIQRRLCTVAMDRIDGLGLAEWIQRERVTFFSAVPAMVHDLLTNPAVTDDMLEPLQEISVGGADMPDAFRRLYEDRFGIPVGTAYGLTEAPTAVTIEDVTRPMVPGSCGKAFPQVEILILDEQDRPVPTGDVGEVCVAPARTGDWADCYRPMLGYWNRPEETAQALRNGILHTGDLGCLDPDGNLFIKDRRNDLILRGGANVYPAEVERVLHDDPRVAACAVLGKPDERLGERVVAFVQLADGTTATADELRDHCAENLAKYKVPEDIRFVEAFDRTPMGKIRKTTLRTAL
jgi:long-chain acyl-CoA synthetase